jgi:hypothetical protein
MSHRRATSTWRSLALRSTWLVVVLGPLPLMMACSDTSAGAPRTTSILSVPETLALTGLPEPLLLVPTLPPPASFEPLPTSSTSTSSSTSLGPPPTVAYQLAEGEVAGVVEGNRILMIGDSILASTAPRFGGPMCATVESYGWSVQIEAEEARHIEFADEVLDELIPAPEAGDDDPPFDVVMVMLGNNYRGDIEDFAAQYDAMLRRLSPLPVVVYTVTEDEAAKAEVNDAIRTLAEQYDNVIMVDWAEKSAAEPDELLAADDLHLSNLGRERLSLFTVAALGKTSVGEPECLDPVFTDDSGS